MSTQQTQHRITQAGPLLTADGRLAEPGWATQQLLEYDRSRIKASKLRIKEWDYYLVNDDDYALALTISDLGFASMASVSLLDFAAGTFVTQSTLGVLSLGKLNLPPTSAAGITAFSDKKASMTFTVAGGRRTLEVAYRDFKDGQTLQARVELDDEPQDTMVIATPWAESPHAFYYNQKIVAMRATGDFSLGNLSHSFQHERSFGLLDWGRGVWTHDNTWFWMLAQGNQSGADPDARLHRVGFNLGYGFGDTTAASENMFFLDGICHKLGRVDFGIPVRDASAKKVGDRYRLMEPWHFTDDEGRLDLVFTPEIDRFDFMDFKIISSDQHQVFGRFDGWVVLDNGTRFDINGLRGAAEAVHNVY